MQLERKKLEITRPACAIIKCGDNSITRERMVLWAQHVVSDVETELFASLSIQNYSNFNHFSRRTRVY